MERREEAGENRQRPRPLSIAGARGDAEVGRGPGRPRRGEGGRGALVELRALRGGAAA